MQTSAEPLRILLAVDGSPQSGAAARHAVRLSAAGLRAEWHLLNVQPALESGHVRMFVRAEDLQSWYREEGLEALDAAAEVFTQAGLAFERHVAVGRAAETILRFVSEKRFDHLLVGTGIDSALSGLLMGSVASAVIRASSVPVTIVR